MALPRLAHDSIVSPASTKSDGLTREQRAKATRENYEKIMYEISQKPLEDLKRDELAALVKHCEKMDVPLQAENGLADEYERRINPAE